MKKSTLFILAFVVVAVGVGGYSTFVYLKEKPPTFLVELLTKTKPPPPLPAGDNAPLAVPEGFVATIFSREVPGARVMILDLRGTMLVSETKDGKVVALPDSNSDGKADKTVTVLAGLTQPHGLLIHCDETSKACTLYVAETGALKKYAYNAETYTATYEKTVATFPTGSGHFTRTLLMHPDGKHILISIGSSCNVCIEKDPKRATVQTFDMATEAMTTFASGLRNSVFMAVNPVDGKIWATENGRDVIGDNIPPDEVNILKEGGSYGWPLCYGKNIHDTDFDSKKYVRDPCADSTPSYIDLAAHSAALGMAFIPEEGWPDGWGNDVLVAYHGSWNRSEPTGYKVVRFDLDDKGVPVNQTPSDFLTGFLAPGAKEADAIGRPVGILTQPGGVVYISDDRAGAIYRVSLKEPPR